MRRLFGELSETEWAEFRKTRPEAHLLQSLEQVKMRSDMGHRSYILGVRDGKEIIAGGVLLGRCDEFWMPYGPLMDWGNAELVKYFLDELVNFARGRGMIRIEVFPDILLALRDSKGNILERHDQSRLVKLFEKAGWRYEGETVSYEMKAGRWAFVKDLTGIKDVESLRKTYRKTLRARLRQTDGDVKITTLKRDELSMLVGLIDESGTKNHVSSRETEYYEQMYDAFGQNVKFLVARKTDDNTPVAGAIFIHNGHEVASYLSGMDRRYRNLNGRAWLQDHVMQKCLKNGVTRVNFFWIEGRFEGNSLLEFKSGFGGVIEEYIGGFEKVLQPTKYQTRRVVRKAKNMARRLIKH